MKIVIDIETVFELSVGLKDFEQLRLFERLDFV